jgi:hypothetical protein
MVNVELAGEARGGVAVLDAELAPGAVAISIDRGLGHAELAGDLLRRKMLVDQPQAFALPRREQAHLFIGNGVARPHSGASKRRLASGVYFNAWVA